MGLEGLVSKHRESPYQNWANCPTRALGDGCHRLRCRRSACRQIAPLPRGCVRQANRPSADRWRMPTTRQHPCRAAPPEPLISAGGDALQVKDRQQFQPVERAIRPRNITRKNALVRRMCGAAVGPGPPAPRFCRPKKMNEVDPHAWLTQTLERIAQGWPISQIDLLMPWNFEA